LRQLLLNQLEDLQIHDNVRQIEEVKGSLKCKHELFDIYPFEIKTSRRAGSPELFFFLAGNMVRGSERPKKLTGGTPR